MRTAIVLLVVTLLTGCATRHASPVTEADPIERLVAKLSADRGMWNTGLFPILGLPQTASPEEVLHRFFSMGLPQGTSYNIQILRIRQVHIPIATIEPNLYTAALVRTSSGEKIVLFKYDGPAVGWWSRVYDAKTLDITFPHT